MKKQSAISNQQSVKAKSCRLTADRCRAERGSSMAWTAIVLTFLLIPFLSLLVDGARLFYVRNRLQTATDAACEDASWLAADRRVFRDSGATAIDAQVIATAAQTFYNTLSERVAMQYSGYVMIVPDYTTNHFYCQGQAEVRLLTDGGFLPPLVINVYSASKMRFTIQQ